MHLPRTRHQSMQLPVTPPGHKTVGGDTVLCGPGEYRADWAAAGKATACDSCGTGVFIYKADVVLVYNTNGATTELAVATSQEDCCEYRAAGCLWCLVCVVTRAVPACFEAGKVFD